MCHRVLGAGGVACARGVRGGVPGPSGKLVRGRRSDSGRNLTQSRARHAPSGPCLSPHSAAPTSRKSSSTRNPTTETFLSRLSHDESPVVWWPSRGFNIDIGPPPPTISGFQRYAHAAFSRAATPASPYRGRGHAGVGNSLALSGKRAFGAISSVASIPLYRDFKNGEFHRFSTIYFCKNHRFSKTVIFAKTNRRKTVIFLGAGDDCWGNWGKTRFLPSFFPRFPPSPRQAMRGETLQTVVQNSGANFCANFCANICANLCANFLNVVLKTPANCCANFSVSRL